MTAISSIKYLITESKSTSPVSKLRGELVNPYGVNFTKFLNKPGYLTATIRMKNPLMTTADILDLTIPLKRSIWVYMNDNVVWAGFIMSRTYASEAGTLQINAVTFDGWYDQIFFTGATSFDFTDSPHRLLNQCWSAALNFNYQYHAYSNGPKELGMPGMPAAFGTSFRLKIPAQNGTSFRQAFDNCIDAGAEYRVQVGGNLFGTSPRAVVPELGMDTNESVMVGRSSSQIVQVLDFPGAITRYWWPESAAASQPTATHLFHFGKAEDGQTFISVGLTAPISTPTDMIWTERAIPIRNAATPSDGFTMANPNYKKYRVPMQQPTFEVDVTNLNVDWPFNFDVGDYFRYTIKDPNRFPNTRIGNARLGAWSFTPPSEDSSAVLGVTLTDQLATITQGGE